MHALKRSIVGLLALVIANLGCGGAETAHEGEATHAATGAGSESDADSDADADSAADTDSAAATDADSDAAADADSAAASEAAADANAADSAGSPPIGGHGAVCRRGAQSPDDTPVYECGPGLQCCYPCGIAGCDSVCHTPEECAMDRMRP